MSNDQVSRRRMIAGTVIGFTLGPAALLADDKQADKALEASKENIEAEAKKQQTAIAAMELDQVRQVMNICCSSPIPNGWIKVNDHWSPTSCGNPTSIVYNVCTIEKYSDRPVGAVMNVCASASTPTGWVDVNTFWSPTSCGHPTSIIHNMKQIKRAS